MFNSLFKNGIDGTQKLIIIGISVTLWIIILGKWKKEQLKKEALIIENEHNK